MNGGYPAPGVLRICFSPRGGARGVSIQARGRAIANTVGRASSLKRGISTTAKLYASWLPLSKSTRSNGELLYTGDGGGV